MGTQQGQSGVGGSGEIVLFLDENHCRNLHVIAAIAAFGIPCEKHLDHFPRATEDTVWLPEVGKNGWYLLTTDASIRYNALERKAVRENAIGMFYFTSNNISGEQMGAALGLALPAVVTLCTRQPRPFIASISKSGAVALREAFAPLP